MRRSVSQLHGGVIFIDDAHDLDPKSSGEGRAIYNEIMRIAEDCRETVTVILAGYRTDIEQKLFAYNPGKKWAQQSGCCLCVVAGILQPFLQAASCSPLLLHIVSISRRHARPLSCHEI